MFGEIEIYSVDEQCEVVLRILFHQNCEVDGVEPADELLRDQVEEIFTLVVGPFSLEFHLFQCEHIQKLIAFVSQRSQLLLRTL